MALTIGDADTPGTMAAEIYDAINTEFGAVTGTLDTDRKRTANAIATGVLTHLVANGDVRITTSDAGLQRADIGGTPNTPTIAPGADVVLSGAIE